MQIPTFFLRTNTRLLIFQALVAWICIRCHNLPIPSTVGFVLTSTLGQYVSTAKAILDSRYGFVLPWEATFFLPAALDAYIIDSMPELAILLGTPPCDERVAKRDPVTSMCIQDIAYQCYYYADVYAHKTKSKKSLQVMEACWENYHTDVRAARKHHDLGHKHEPATLMQLIGCVQVVEYWEKKSEKCGRIQPIRHCIASLGAWEFVADLRERNPHLVKEPKAGKETTIEGGEGTTKGPQVEAATS
ncbi:unnamed protein product [Aureobasidium vineae]|uniref:Uncharacterized protein n=1 Tax=Aureobasidium vineae TaxID=2773715 RepID=A0A9N8JG25_9PEZI|nr:unnamed protein product [Aureobasidium vineae]